jgi:ABC-type arginine transport system ATPase subunit
MRKLAATDAVINYSLQAMQAGANGIMVDWNTIYNAMKDRARYAGMDFPEQYWIDPSSPEAQQAMQQQQQAQQQQQQYQTWMFLQQIQTMIEAEKTKRLQLAAEQERATEDRMLEYDKLVNDYTHDMTKLELEYVADVPGSAV